MPLYYNLSNGNGQMETRSAAGDLGDNRGFADGRESSLLSAVESATTKMKDGRTHLAHKAEHAIDLETGAIVSVTVTAHRYLLNRRIERARRLLGQADMSIAQVAYRCGFSSQAHLTLAFRRACRLTPGEYRREL